jgi:hypothetical protein
MGLLKKLSIGAFVAIVSAVILRILLPLPVLTVFAALYFFFLLQIIERYFGAGASIVVSWGRVAVRTAVAFAAFVTLRFLVGQVLGLYPIDAYHDWGTDGGLMGVFWGHQASRHIVLEVILIGFIGWMLWGYLRKRWMAKIGVFAFTLFIVAGVVFPLWASKWPERKYYLDRSLADKGLVKTIRGDRQNAFEEEGNCPNVRDPETDFHVSAEMPYVVVRHKQRGLEKDCFGVLIHLHPNLNTGQWHGWCYVPYAPPGAELPPDWTIRFKFGQIAFGPYRWSKPLLPEDTPNFSGISDPYTFRVGFPKDLLDGAGVEIYPVPRGTTSCDPYLGGVRPPDVEPPDK